jgi:cysteine synthase A
MPHTEGLDHDPDPHHGPHGDDNSHARTSSREVRTMFHHNAAVPPVHEHITDAVKTPSLIRLSPNAVLVRFETLKVYAALGAVRHLLDTGVLRPGQTLVDSSSGIYALA